MVVAVAVAVEKVVKSLWLIHFFHCPLLPGTTKKDLLTRGLFCVTLGLNREQRLICCGKQIVA